MNNASGRLQILECLHRQPTKRLIVENLRTLTGLSSDDFEQSKQMAIREGDISEANGFLILENKGMQGVEELRQALQNFKTAIAKGKDRDAGRLKTYEVIFRHGKLYNRETNERLIFKEGAVVEIDAYNDSLLTKDPYNLPLQGRGEAEVLASIEKKNYYSFRKIAVAGDYLTFIIKAGKKTSNGGYAVQCEFTVRLLDDLYLFRKTAQTTYGLVFDCSCVVESNYGSIENFEPIYAYSLNDAYTKTFEWYFGLYGKSTTNVYNTFWLIKGDEKKLLSQIRMYPSQ